MGRKTEEIISGIISELESKGINIEEFREQSYDNVANLSGMYSGLEAKFWQNQTPFAV